MFKNILYSNTLLLMTQLQQQREIRIPHTLPYPTCHHHCLEEGPQKSWIEHSTDPNMIPSCYKLVHNSSAYFSLAISLPESTSHAGDCQTFSTFIICQIIQQAFEYFIQQTSQIFKVSIFTAIFEIKKLRMRS